MDESNPTTSATQKLNYFNLLQELDKLSKLTIELNIHCDDAELDTICNNLAENIERVCRPMTSRRSTMFVITIFNTLIRISTIYKFGCIISRKSFQSLIIKLHNLLSNTFNEIVHSVFANDIRDSMLMNLAKDNLAEKCFNRLLSNETSQQNNASFNQFISYYLYLAAIFIIPEFNLPPEKFEKNYSSLMTSFLMYLNNLLIRENSHEYKAPLNVIVSVLNLILELTDKVPLIPIFADLGYIEKTIQWIGTDLFALHIDELGRPIFAIIHNLSRSKFNSNELRRINAFDKLMDCKRLVDNKNENELTKSFGTALLSLSTSDEPPEESKLLILETSRTLYNVCKETGRSHDLRYDGFHLSELLELLHRAFSNTYVIKDILDNARNEQPSPIQYFPELLLSIYGVLLDREPIALEKRAAEYLLKILLQISSYPEYQDELMKNNELCVVIESLANRPKQDVAKRIACNLQLSTIAQEFGKEKSLMIYISYDWTDQEFCKRFVDELRKKITVPIWVDYEHMELCDDMWEYLSSMIKSATVIITLISTAYGENTNKFQELSYIVSENKLRDKTRNLIVVKAEPNFKFNRSWMKELLSDTNPIPYEYNVDNMISNVCDQIDVSKKPSNKCIPCKIKHEQKKIGTSSHFPPSDSSLPLVNTDVWNQSTDTFDFRVLNTTKKQHPLSIVSSLFTQTGSTNSSTWV